jgi:UDP-N-acetylmuramyl pentapeptide synthase
MQNNRVFINEQGIIEIQVVGDQTVESVQVMGDKALALAREQQTKGNSVLLLDNLLEMGTVPAEARRRVADLIKSNDYDRLAMLGRGSVLRFGANLILQATGKGSKVKYFEDRAACTAWLLQD